MGFSSGSRPGWTITVELIVAIAIALIILALTLPALNLIWRILAVVGLGILAFANLAVLAGLPGRVRLGRLNRRHFKALNVTSRLIPDLAQLTESTEKLLYLDNKGSLFQVVRMITEKTKVERAKRLEPRLNELRRHFRVFKETADPKGTWDKSTFIGLVRGIGKHFEFIDPVLDACYGIAKSHPVGNQVVERWSLFREKYNQLRSDWMSYFDRVAKAIDIHADLEGNPARELSDLG